MSKNIVAIILAAVIVSGSIVYGDLTIDIRDNAMVAGENGSVDIWVESTSVDPVALFSFRVGIERLTGSGELMFLPSSIDASDERQRPDEHLDPDYVFFNNATQDNFTAIRQDPNRLELVGGDYTTDANDVLLTSTSRLLARIELTHLTPTPETSSGTYRVFLIADPDFTFFLDSQFDFDNQRLIDPRSFDQTDSIGYGSGIITVSPASAVPEPSSLLLCSIASCAYLIRRTRTASYLVAK